MKKVLSVIIGAILLCAATGFSAAAFSDPEHGVSFKTPEGFYELNAGNSHDNPELLKQIGYTEKSFDNYVQKSGIIYFALNGDNSKQIIIRCQSTVFSQNLNDLSDLGEEGIDALAKEILPKDYKEYAIVRGGDTVYLELSTAFKDSGGNFYTVQYFTVKNGYLYSISFNYGGAYDKNAFEITDGYMQNLTITTQKVSTGGGKNIFFTILVIIIIAAALLLIIRLSFSLVKDLRKVKKDSGEVKINRRKY